MLPRHNSPVSPAAEQMRLAALDAYQIMRTPAEAAFDRLVTLGCHHFPCSAGVACLHR